MGGAARFSARRGAWLAGARLVGLGRVWCSALVTHVAARISTQKLFGASGNYFISVLKYLPVYHVYSSVCTKISSSGPRPGQDRMD